MGTVVLAGATSGSTTLSPTDAVTTVITLPSSTDTLVGKATTDTLTNKTLGSTVVQASNAAPAFSAYLNANQTLSNNAFTKIACNTEEFDTNNNYDNATNYRFTPTVAGYYNITGGARVSATALTDFVLVIYKNGSEYKRGSGWLMTASTVQLTCANLVYLNGSTDYVEIYAYMSATSGLIAAGGASFTYFQAAMIRSA